MVELGNEARNHYRPLIRVIEDNPRLTWDIVGRTEAFAYNRPGVTRIFQHYNQPKPTFGMGMTSLTWIQSRFDLARQWASGDNYQYGIFLLLEECWHPWLQASWGESSLSSWNIDGTLTLPNGTVLEALKPWYIRTKGAWSQSWWDSVRTTNNLNDSTVKTWSAYYGYTLLKAWHEFMHSLGKKSCLMNLGDFRNNGIRSNYLPGQMFDYVIRNFDMVVTYTYPKTLTEVTTEIGYIQTLRNSWGYAGKITHILTSCWSDGAGCPWVRSVAEEEFKQLLAYANLIVVTAFADASEWTVTDSDIPNHTAYPPLLVTFKDTYDTGTPPPTPTPDWIKVAAQLTLIIGALYIIKGEFEK